MWVGQSVDLVQSSSGPGCKAIIMVSPVSGFSRFIPLYIKTIDSDTKSHGDEYINIYETFSGEHHGRQTIYIKRK